MPIIHVNADDVEACLAAAKLAHAFRETFGRDALIDLIGYRRFGHNETDEPAYTQPVMYERIKGHPPVRKLYAEQLRARGRRHRRGGRADGRRAPTRRSPRRTRSSSSRSARRRTPASIELDRTMSREPRTTVPEDTLRSLNEQLLRVPDGFDGPPQAASRSWRSAARRSRSRTGASTGRTPSRWRSPRCWRWACRCA